MLQMCTPITFVSINQSIYLNQKRIHRTAKTLQKNTKHKHKNTQKQTDRQRKCNWQSTI